MIDVGAVPFCVFPVLPMWESGAAAAGNSNLVAAQGRIGADMAPYSAGEVARQVEGYLGWDEGASEI